MAPHTSISRAGTQGLGLNGGQEGNIIKQSWPILTWRLKAHYPSFHHPQRFLGNFELLSDHWINCLNSLIAEGKNTSSFLENLLILNREWTSILQQFLRQLWISTLSTYFLGYEDKSDILQVLYIWTGKQNSSHVYRGNIWNHWYCTNICPTRWQLHLLKQIKE